MITPVTVPSHISACAESVYWIFLQSNDEYCNNNNSVHLYSSLRILKALFSDKEGNLPQPAPMCSTPLGDATAPILSQDAHHTSTDVERLRARHRIWLKHWEPPTL